MQDLEDSPQQENCSDCGIFVCVIMKHLLLRRLLTTPTVREINMSMGRQDVDARKGRLEIGKVIEKQRREAKVRSRSRSPMVGGREGGVRGDVRSPPRIG